jgi:hypothetical protein
MQLEGMPESTVTSVTTFACQLLGGKRTMSINSFVIKADKMIDA